jgi:hypothetical protein
VAPGERASDQAGGRKGRRDRLLLLLAIAQTLMTLLGAASERSGMDKYL